MVEQERLQATVATEPAAVDLDDIPVAPVTAKTVADFVERAKHTEALRRAVLAQTSESQWHDFGGKPYMEADAAYTIAANMGISFEAPQYEFRDLGNGETQCVCTVRAHYAGRRFEDIGDCDSFDDFLMKRREDLKRGAATDDQIRQVLRVELQKKARANAVSRAVSGLTGLRGLSWEDLDLLGLRRGRVARTEFRKGGAGGKVQSGSLAELAALPIGSTLSVTARVERVDVPKEGSKAPFRFHVSDGGATMIVTTWKEDGAQPGQDVFCDSVKVEEYQGKRQYKAASVAVAKATDSATEGGAE